VTPLRKIFFLALFLLLSSALLTAQSTLLKNVMVYDGGGRKPFRADVRITGDKIAAVGQLKPEPSDTVQDERGLALAPGFIDMHSHADEGLLDNPTADVAIRQGITTVLVGQDGGSEFPLADWLGRVEKTGTSLNVASMVGQATIRKQIMGDDLYRPSTPQELNRMRALLRDELRAGAFGLSTGLEYEPAHFSTTEEVIELAKVAADWGGFYISHVRDEGNNVFDSFQEILRIGREAKLPVEITHIKLGTTPVWHLASKRMPALFAQAKKEKVDLRADVYPYTYWASTIRVLLTDRDWFNAEKVEKALAENGGAANIRLSAYSPNPKLAGKTLEQVAQLWNVSPTDAYMRIVRETQPQAGQPAPEEGIIGTSMSEDDVRWFIADPRIAFCTDGVVKSGEHDHPRSAGAFPRILGRYVREQKVLTLEEAIHKASRLPAERLGLRDRGRIAPGAVADLVLFDPARVIDRATLDDPQAAPDGIPAVMVSGKWVVQDGKVTGALPGKVLRHFAPPRLR
jgi:N-acyl-D-amino-acid deacylase